MTADDHIDWAARWHTGSIGFHRADVHPDLVAFEDRFLGADPRRVLIPLCGKTVDVGWLASRGHEVIGVELVEVAVVALFAELGVSPQVDAVSEHVTAYRAGRITVLCGDVFAVTQEQVGPVDRVWDRAALIAMPPTRRARYVAQLRSLIGTGSWVLLQNALAYDQARMQGPPFSVPPDEVRAHYADVACEILRDEDIIDSVPFKDAGHEYWRSTAYLIGPR